MLLAAATMENRKPPMVCQQSDERSSLVAPSRDARATPKRSNSLKYASLCTLALVGTCAAIAGPHRAARPLEAAGITNPSPEKTSHVERSSSRRALLAMHDGYGSPPPDTTTTYDETYYSYPDSSPDVYYASPPTTEPRRRSRDPDCPDETYDETYYSYPDHDDGDWDHDDHDDHDHDHDHDHKPDRDRDHPPEGSDDGPDPGAMFAVAAVVGVVFAAVFALCCRLCRRSRTENTKVVVFDYPATGREPPGEPPREPPREAVESVDARRASAAATGADVARRSPLRAARVDGDDERERSPAHGPGRHAVGPPPAATARGDDAAHGSGSLADGAGGGGAAARALAARAAAAGDHRAARRRRVRRRVPWRAFVWVRERARGGHARRHRAADDADCLHDVHR